MGSDFAKVVNNLAEVEFQALYGRWDPMGPGQVAELFSGSGVRWWVAGGRGGPGRADLARGGAADR